MCARKKSFYLFLTLLSLVSSVSTARILGIFPIYSKSHQVVFQSYIQELAKKGHELVVLTPDPINDSSLKNLTEINLITEYGSLVQNFGTVQRYYKRGVIMDGDVVVESGIYHYFLEGIVKAYTHPEVINLINDKQQKFDLIVVEAFFEYQLIFSEIFKAPVIMFATFMGFPRHYEMLGAIGRHPVYYPNFQRAYFENLGVWETLRELYNEYRFYQKTIEVENHQDELLKKNFGPNAPTTSQLKKNVDLLFLSVHPMLANNRPVPPNIVYLHALHLKPVKDLPVDLKTYLDKSKTGVVYVSFGSNVKSVDMHKEFLDEFIKAFKKLPYDILWKYNGEDLSAIPKNVKVYQWFPQRDLLHHPNVKVFVTQAGIQSTTEAIDAGVPLVGVPMGAEQFYNAQKFVDFNIGVKLDSLTLVADDLVQGVKTVFENKSYKDNVVKLGNIFRDNSQDPLERAVWWTEYVLRHGGAKHLRTHATDASFAEYYMLNYVFLILGAVTSILLAVLLGLYIAIKSIVGSSTRKLKKKSKSE